MANQQNQLSGRREGLLRQAFPEGPPFQVLPAVPLDMVLSDTESVSSVSDSVGHSEDAGLLEAVSFDEDESEVEPEAPSVCESHRRDAGSAEHHEVGAAVHARKLSNRHEDSVGGDFCRRTQP